MAEERVMCERCNYDQHRCPGCGASVDHGVVSCGQCHHHTDDGAWGYRRED